MLKIVTNSKEYKNHLTISATKSKIKMEVNKMNELKEAILNAKSISKINTILAIAMDSLTGLTAEELEELREIATEQKQAIYNNRYI